MTKTEQAKAKALSKCRLAKFHDDQKFVAGLCWLAEHSPDSALSRRQKWYLDVLLWRYRKQLAGREEGFDLPTAMPSEAEYMKPPGRQAPIQPSLL